MDHKQKAPATISAQSVQTTCSLYLYRCLPVEPEFEKGKTYEYNVTGPLTFELCATFSAPMPKGWQEYGGVAPMYRYDSHEGSYPYPGSGVNESWDHQAGRTCFSRTIDKDMYPPYPKQDNI